MKALLLFAAILSLASLEARQYQGSTDAILDEVRLELSDLKHELKSALVDINLIDERVRKQNATGTAGSKTADLEKKVTNLEKLLEKAISDLRTLNTTTTTALNKIQELEKELATHDQRLNDVHQLKGTLTSLSKAIGSSTPMDATYRVKAGDSLEKIARVHKISVDTLKKLNQLQSDKIIIGQELKIAQ